jgi:hypothetical protein
MKAIGAVQRILLTCRNTVRLTTATSFPIFIAKCNCTTTNVPAFKLFANGVKNLGETVLMASNNFVWKMLESGAFLVV